MSATTSRGGDHVVARQAQEHMHPATDRAVHRIGTGEVTMEDGSEKGGNQDCSSVHPRNSSARAAETSAKTIFVYIAMSIVHSDAEAF